MIQYQPNDLAAFTVIVTFIVISPGPNLFLLLSGVPLSGRPAGFFMTFGFCAAIITHAILAMAGVGAIIATSAVVFMVLKFIGAAYLIYLGIKSVTSMAQPLPMGAGRTKADSGSQRLVGHFGKGFGTNILNPKPGIFYLAAFPQFIGHSDGGMFFLSGLILAFIHAFIALLFYGTVVICIDAANTWLRRPRVWQVVKSVSGVVLVFLGIRLLLAETSELS